MRTPMRNVTITQTPTTTPSLVTTPAISTNLPPFAAQPADPLTTGLVLLCEHGVTGAIVKCYACGKRITKASMGAVVWDYSDTSNESEPIFLCKGEDAGYTTCLNAIPWKTMPWQQLDGFLGHLLWNVGIRTTRQFRDIMEKGDLEMRV